MQSNGFYNTKTIAFYRLGMAMLFEFCEEEEGCCISALII